MSVGKKSFFSPFRFWANVFKPSTTVRFPREEIDVFDKPGASPTYRGMHTNDITLCIGCGTCEDICPTNAITFGNLEDKNSRVYQLAHSDEAYVALEELGTKPAVHYLRKKGKHHEA